MQAEAQERCDRLYAMVNSSEWAGLAGKTSHQIVALLGPPDRVSTLVREGVTWTRIKYDCSTLPSDCTPDERAAFQEGWRFTASLLLRNGIVVNEADFHNEITDARLAAGPPAALKFVPGGTFP